MADVYVIILNYKNWQDTRECLESLSRLHHRRFKVIVVDNNSGNGSLEHLMEWADTQLPVPAAGAPRYQYFASHQLPERLDSFDRLPSIVFMQNPENNGFAEGNNLALRLLLQENAYIWLLNPDMTTQENALTALLQFAGNHSPKTITGTTIKNYLPPHEVLQYGAKINFNSATVDHVTDIAHIPKIDYVCGGSLFAHTRHFNDIGLLPTDYFLYWEETDWCYQARQKGYDITVCTEAVCFDKISTSIGRGFLADYYYTRNGLIFLSKYKKQKLPLAFFFIFLRFMKRILSGQWAKAKGVYKGTITFLNKGN